MGATPIPHDLTTAWQLALEFWSQPVRHDTLLGLAAKHKQFAWLAGKYKDAARSNPTDPVASDRLVRLQRAAAIVMMAKPPEVETVKKPFRAASMLLVGAVLATGLGLVVADQKVQQAHEQRSMVSTHP